MAYKTEITYNEGLYLSSVLSMHHKGPPDSTYDVIYPNLLLKLGGAILESNESETKRPATVHLTEQELWVVREMAKSHVTVGTEKVGLNLLIKAYTGLLQLRAESVTQYDELAEDQGADLDKATFSTS